LTFSRGGARGRPPNAFPPQPPSNKLTIESNRSRNGGEKTSCEWRGEERSRGERAAAQSIQGGGGEIGAVACLRHKNSRRRRRDPRRKTTAARSHLYLLPLPVVESWQARLAGPACQSRPEATSKRGGLTDSASRAHLSVDRTVMRCGGRGDPVRACACRFPSLTVKKNAVACVHVWMHNAMEFIHKPIQGGNIRFE
jgi:hypothetical protein